MALLELKNITKTYAGEVSVEVLQQIDLKVPEGEFISIMGPSGSGKTTMLNLVATLDKPTAGSVIIKESSRWNYLSKNSQSFVVGTWALFFKTTIYFHH